MSQDKEGASNNITGKKLAGCFVTSFCSEHSSRQKRVNPRDKLQEYQSEVQINQDAKTPSQSVSANQADLPRCKMLIMGDFTQSSQRKESYLSGISWKKLPGARAPKFYSETKATHHLTIHDICECDKNSYTVALRSSTYIVLVPSSDQDLSLCCHAVFDKHQLLSRECKVVYLNLAAPNSHEHLAIEAIAKKWVDMGFNLSSVDAPSVEVLLQKAVEHTKSINQQLSLKDYNESQDNQGSSQTVKGMW